MIAMRPLRLPSGAFVTSTSEAAAEPECGPGPAGQVRRAARAGTILRDGSFQPAAAARPRTPVAMFRMAAAPVLLLPALAAACPNCADAMSDSLGTSSRAAGYAWSILLMLVLVFALLGVFAWLVRREIRRRRPPGSGGAPRPQDAPPPPSG